MNHKWNYRPITPEQAETSQTLAQELGISPILGQLLVQRGITKAADAKKFFRPQLPDLHDPFLMKDMDIAVERLNRAMGKKERILIYGDYDVDGTTCLLSPSDAADASRGGDLGGRRSIKKKKKEEMEKREEREKRKERRKQ